MNLEFDQFDDDDDILSSLNNLKNVKDLTIRLPYIPKDLRYAFEGMQALETFNKRFNMKRLIIIAIILVFLSGCWNDGKSRQNVTDKSEAELIAAVGEDVAKAVEKPETLRLVINDLTQRFPDQYNGTEFSERFEKICHELDIVRKNLLDHPQNYSGIHKQYIGLVKEFSKLRKEILLANPLMQFDKLLFRRAKDAGLEPNWISNAARHKGMYENALAVVSPQHAQETATTLIENPCGSFIGDINLHWNAEKILVTALGENNTWQIFELSLSSTEMRQITHSVGSDVDNVEGCYMPDGSILFISTASMMGVPCIDGRSPVGTIYRQESDGKTVRQLTFEQDQDWCPTLMPNGRVMYLRWEYVDTPHYFTRILFSMNPDGTNQTEYYGSNSYWPNSLFNAKSIPGNSNKFIAIVSGHHGDTRCGELVLFDVSKGRRETEGVVQRIPGFGKKVEPIIADHLVDNSFPKFLHPAPLDENYYIVSAQMKSGDNWALYLVDRFDNMLKLREEANYGLFEPTPVIKKPQPPVRPNQVDLSSKESIVFLSDIYFGDGLKNIPKGSVKKLRVFSYNFGYRGLGSHRYFGMESCWDARRILGEVPVYEDGSASFIIPANTPVAVQPLDEKGRALQLMRTWFVGMPGENQSCIGCHESQNTAVPSKRTIAMGKQPVSITPFLGKPRPFSFSHEIQPILVRYCVGCHDGQNENKERPNFANTQPGAYGFSRSYHALHPFVRRPGPESDYHLLAPMEYHGSTSELFQRLEKGHHGVQLDDDSLRRLYTWVDLNVPYFGTWIEVAEANPTKRTPEEIKKVAARHAELKSRYAGIDFNPEKEPYAGLEIPQKIEFVKPMKSSTKNSAPNLNWTFDAKKAKEMQVKPKETIKINDTVSFDLVWIPAGKFVMGDHDGEEDEQPLSVIEIKKPFHIMTTEVTNELFALYDSKHDSRYVDQWYKDHTSPGYPANEPKQPVIRVTWNESVSFCEWLSTKTGRKFRLPTEAEWEWAARAGTDTPMWYGTTETDFGKFENMADKQTKLFVIRGYLLPMKNPAKHEAFLPHIEEVDDGKMIAQNVGGYYPNAWGLFDIHGSVAEWTSSDYRPYPYKDIPNDPKLRKVARGGSWSDRPQMSRSAIRRAYEAWQPVFNVGFRAICD